MKKKPLCVPCVNLCDPCGKNLNRKERKEDAKNAKKEKILSDPCVNPCVPCGKKP